MYGEKKCLFFSFLVFLWKSLCFKEVAYLHLFLEIDWMKIIFQSAEKKLALPSLFSYFIIKNY